MSNTRQIIEQIGFATYSWETEEELETILDELIDKGHTTKDNVDTLRKDIE
jgi:polyhydroxyalkanoate synthesis regulator phasin